MFILKSVSSIFIFSRIEITSRPEHPAREESIKTFGPEILSSLFSPDPRVNVDSFAALQNGILSSSTTSGVNDYEYGFALEVRNDNKFRCKISSGGSTTNWLIASDTSSKGKWYHIACVATPTQLEL